ncbi:MAG: matrixin family metalloprotease [Actinomycetota bacterium]|nr:matrixin family metalloprotease [Actinomycetota bacterium]
MAPKPKTQLVRWLAQINVVTFCVAVFVALTFRMFAIGPLDFGIGDRWPLHHHDLIIVDRTGDPDWHAAIVAAKATWDRAGDDLRLTITTDTGPCQQVRDHIEVCQEPLDGIAARGLAGEEGLFLPQASARQYRSAEILVCSDCALDQDRRVVIATHEIGHSIGLAHNPDPVSVMYPSGGSPDPDARDYQILRSLEGPPSPPGQAAP